MAIASPLLEAFNAGEFSPRMAARLGFDKYKNAAAVMKNLLALPQGGTTRRPGTRYVGDGYGQNAVNPSKLIPFEASANDAYILELSQGDAFIPLMRPFRQQTPVSNTAVTCAVTNGTFDTNITGWSDLSTGTGAIAWSSLLIGGNMKLTAGATGVAWAEQSVTTSNGNVVHVVRFTINGFPWVPCEIWVGSATGTSDILSRTVYPGYYSIEFTPGTTTFYLQFKTSYAGRDSYLDDVVIVQGKQTELQTPYGTDELPDVSYAQSSDIMYVVHPDLAVARLERRDHRDWSLVFVDWQDGPYLLQNLGTTTFTPSATTGENITVTASSTSGINDGAGFDSILDIGRLVRIQHSTNEPGWGVIVAVSSTTVCTVAVRRAFSAITASTDWALGAWSGSTGYPSAVTFFEDRLIMASTTNQPQTFWGSQSLADYENMRADSYVGSAVTVEADDAYIYTIAAEKTNAIKWLVSGRELFIGTSGGEWVVTAQGSFVSPLDIDVKRHTAYGSTNHLPVLAGNAVLFINRSMTKVHEFAYSFDVDAYIAPDITILADHVGMSALQGMAYQQNPDTVVWCRRADGTIATLTYRRQQNVVGWTRQTIGGTYSGGNAVVESIATIPGNSLGAPQVYDSDDRDEVWLVVLRTINGATYRSIEVLEGSFVGPVKDDFDNEADFDAAMLAVQETAYYVDAGYTYEGVATDTITGLTWLEGETVNILANGAVHPSRVVSGGSITLDDNIYTVVHVGLPYNHRYVSLKLPFGAAAGTGMTKRKTIRNVGMALLDTGPFKIGTSVANLKDVSFREVGDAMDTPVPLFTGEIIENVEGGYMDDPRIIIDSDNPTGFTLLGLVPDMRTHEAR